MSAHPYDQLTPDVVIDAETGGIAGAYGPGNTDATGGCVVHGARRQIARLAHDRHTPGWWEGSNELGTQRDRRRYEPLSIWASNDHAEFIGQRSQLGTVGCSLVVVSLAEPARRNKCCPDTD